jgi:heat-inducible transcriptional repressor
MSETLSPRSDAVLDLVVENYIGSGQPVGSTSVAAAFAEPISSATIRNVMAELEALGYLFQPHTSAGRVPTEKGYRRYVERLFRQRRLHRIDERSIRRRLSQARLEVGELLHGACSLLSELSNHVGVVLTPRPSRTVVQHIEFIRTGADRALLLFVTQGGMVHTRTIKISEELDDSDLEAAASDLAARFAGRTLGEIRDRLMARRRSEASVSGERQWTVIDLAAQWLDDFGRAEVLVEGASRLLDNPELSRAEVLQNVFATFEEPTQLTDVLAECGGRYDPSVLIGSDSLPAALGGCTLIAASYMSGGSPVGALGVLGPTRMHYEFTIPLVAATARATSEAITELYS